MCLIIRLNRKRFLHLRNFTLVEKREQVKTPIPKDTSWSYTDTTQTQLNDPRLGIAKIMSTLEVKRNRLY